MVEVLNSEKGSSINEDINSIKLDVKKLKTDIQSCDKKTEELKVSLIIYTLHSYPKSHSQILIMFYYREFYKTN